MADQQAFNYQIALKDQTGLNAPASGSGAVGFDISGGSGVQLSRGSITDPTFRRDGLSVVDGLGMRSGTANYQMVLGVQKQDILWPRLVRTGGWTTIGPFTQSTYTSFTTGANTVVFAAGNLRTAGLRRFMRFKLSGQATTTANNGRWLTVRSVSSDGLTVTVAETILVNATPTTTFSMTVGKFAYSGTVPVDTYSTIEDYAQDIAAREPMQDAKLARFALGTGPDAKAIGTFDWVGRDVIPDDTTGSSIFTSPTYAGGYGLEMSDGFIIKDGVVSSIVTDISFTYDMSGTVEKILGPVGRDVSLGASKLSGSISAIRSDLAYIKGFRAKTTFEQVIILAEPGADPADFISFGMGVCMPGQPGKNFGASGTSKNTAPFTAGVDLRGGDCAKTTLLISSSLP